MRTVKYNRSAAVTYAKKWALSRNPRYYNFDGLGGDCTNFASQCVFAGSGVMNYTKDVGWYYNSPADRAAAWSGVRYLHTFLTTNRGVGPFGKKNGTTKNSNRGFAVFAKRAIPVSHFGGHRLSKRDSARLLSHGGFVYAAAVHLCF